MLNAANFARVQAAKGRKVLALTKPLNRQKRPTDYAYTARQHRISRRLRPLENLIATNPSEL